MAERMQRVLDRAKNLTPAAIAGAGTVLALLSLLANNAGLAIIFASLVIPVVVIVEITRRDLIKEEPRWSQPAMFGWGVLVGIVLGALGATIAAEWWIDGAPLHVGAAGFGGEVAAAEGSPGFAVLLFNGIVLPVIAVSVAALGPYWMRRYPEFRNEVMDGVSLGAAAGCGLATGTTIVFVWPLVGGGETSGGSVADWTAMLLGVLVTRPVIFGLAVAFVCAGVWHVAITQRSVDLMLPVGAGLGGAIVFAVGDLLIQPSGTRWELLWHLFMMAVLAIAAWFVVARALVQDRQARTVKGPRVVCPTCGAATPVGLFCAVCGSRLEGDDAEQSLPTFRENVSPSGTDPTEPIVVVEPNS
jgi:hypothetical protein